MNTSPTTEINIMNLDFLRVKDAVTDLKALREKLRDHCVFYADDGNDYFVFENGGVYVALVVAHQLNPNTDEHDIAEVLELKEFPNLHTGKIDAIRMCVDIINIDNDL